MGRDMVCDNCKEFASVLHRQEGDFWVCRHCYVPPSLSAAPYLKQMENVHNNVHGSTAHLNDIRDRRWHPTEKRTFYYSKEQTKTYFLPKG